MPVQNRHREDQRETRLKAVKDHRKLTVADRRKNKAIVATELWYQIYPLQLRNVN